MYSAEIMGGISPIDRGVGIEGSYVADKDEPGDLGAILKRIDELVELTGQSDRAVSIAATGTPWYIDSMKKQYRSKKQFSAKKEKLKRLVGPLNTTFEYLWRGTGTKVLHRSKKQTETRISKNEIAEDRRRVLVRHRVELPSSGQPILGVVEPGIFSEADHAPSISMMVPTDPGYPIDQQFAYLVRGTSVNEVAAEGDCLIAIDLELTGVEPQSHQTVIVTRTRAGLIETTARRLFLADEHIELTFPSSDPRFHDQEPLRIPTRKFRKTKVDDAEIELRGLVVFVYRQV